MRWKSELTHDLAVGQRDDGLAEPAHGRARVGQHAVDIGAADTLARRAEDDAADGVAVAGARAVLAEVDDVLTRVRTIHPPP